ncbi:MAG: toast rack family protein [Chloroflexota bacterium]|nr:toast rack family protein [Chloroflexota bacterium]
MKKVIITLTAIFLLGSTLACNITAPQMPDIDVTIPDIDIPVPTLQVGEMQDERQAIPLSGATSATIEIFFGAGELEIEAGTFDDLFSGHFRYNIEQWEPKVTYKDDVLTVEQGSTKDWGIPTGNTHNEWELEFSPEIPLEMNLKAGAGEGEFDFTGLQLASLDVELGAGNFEIRFDKLNDAEMSHLKLNTGASKLKMIGIGHAGPAQMEVQGGVGDINLDFTGDWPNSADVRITAGVGAVTLRLPDDVGVRVETEGGLTSIETDGLQRKGDAYVNDAFGETETELRIHVTTGIGNLRLIKVSN